MIRRVTAADVDRYREIRLRALQDSPSAFGSTYEAERQRPQHEWSQRIAQAASGNNRATFLAFDGADCVGLVGCADDDLGADRQLVSMWVAPSHRGTGLASELVNAALSWAKEAGANSVGLWVTRENDRARRLYEHTGFSETGDVQPLPSDPRKEEIRMFREI
jgi:GNAT superfamily N-acetyltransferase